MIETIIPFIVLLYSSSLALGVGASTLAASSFLIALEDGSIDTSERKILGGIYTALRVAMILILATSLFLVWQVPSFFENQTPYVFALIVILYVNAISMTQHWTSVKFNPALQAATWYTLGFVTGIQMFELFELTLTSFIALYVIDIIVAVLIINFFISRVPIKDKC